MKRWRWMAAALVVVVLVGAWKVWNECWLSLLCVDGMVALDRDVNESLAERSAKEKAWFVEHPDKEFLDGYTASPHAHLPTVRGLFGFSFLLENGRLLSPKEALGLRMGLNADLRGPALPATAVALVDSPRGAGHQQDILWSDGRLTRNQHFDARTGTASPGRWTEEQPDSVQIDDGVALVSGGNFRLVLRRDGTVWGYGGNGFGQLGTLDKNPNEALNSQWLPLTRPVAGLNDVKAIAAGFRHALALKSDGTVWQWGANNTHVKSRDLEFRDNRPGLRQTDFFNPAPSRVPGLVDIVKIAAGQSHSVALDKNGVVWAWGDSEGGRLGIPFRFSKDVIGYDNGNSTKVIKSTFVDEPVRVPGIEQVIDIAAAGNHTIALKQDGTVWGWGMNTSGQLGAREYKDRQPSLDADPARIGKGPDSPFPMFGVQGIRRIFTSASYSALVDKNGDLFLMGGGGAYDFALRVPGRAGQKTRIQFSLEMYGASAAERPTLDSEVGLYALDDSLGRVNGLLPGDPGYASAALAPSRVVPVFEPGHRYGFMAGSTTHPETWLKLDAERLFGFYVIFNSNRSAWVRENPTNENEGKIKALFSFPGANPDGLEYGYLHHVRPSYPGYSWSQSAVSQFRNEGSASYILSGRGLRRVFER